MKYFFFLLGLAAITVGSALFVAPHFREFHEGRLKKDVREALYHYDSSMDLEFKMNHLHAKEITVTKIPQSGETKKSVKKDIVEIVRGVYGATTDPVYVNVIFEHVPAKPDQPVNPLADKPDKPDKPEDSDAVAKATPNPLVKPIAEAKSEPEPEPANPNLKSSEIYVEWNDLKNEISLDGKLSDPSDAAAILALVNKQFKSAVITDKMNADKDNYAKSGKVLQIKNYIPTIINANVAQGSVKIVDRPASVRLTGTLRSKEEFEALTAKLKPMLKSSDDKPLKVENEFKYHPKFIIEKDDKQRVVVLKGYANRNDSVNLSSYIKRYSPIGKKQYKFKSEIIQDERCTRYAWTENDQKILDNQLSKTVRGKIYYENNKLYKITGETNDEQYQKSLTERYADTTTKIELTYKKATEPETAIVKPNESEMDAAAKEKIAKEKQAIATQKLRADLKLYKIYFDSGKKDPAVKYDLVLQEIATAIRVSKDKKSVIVIGGFADHTGDPASNEILSKQRAASVQAKLVKLGVPISRTVVEFFGAEGTDADKKLSRRVEIRVR